MSVKREAKKFCKIFNNKLNFVAVKHYYEWKGWQIHYFSGSDEVIEELGLDENAVYEKGFIYDDGVLKYIFINSNLSECEKRNVIFHEAGHIELNHKFSDLNDEAKEREAQEFASELIKYASTDKKSLIKTGIVSAAVLVTVAVSFYFIGSKTSTWQTNNSNTVNTVAPAEDTSDTKSQYVYVTSSGKKYHIKDCYYIRNNKTLQKIDLKTAEQNYLPCSICIKQ